jgi:PKD repeat protein
VTKVYPTARTLTVRLRVTDAHGAANTEVATLTINRAPFAAFAFNPEAPVINEPVTFTPSGSFDFENSIETFEWDLDGNLTFETTGENPPPKTYASAGTVSVGLRVTDEDGGVTVVRRNLTVGLTRPRAGLTFAPANPLPGQRVTLVSTSAPSATPGAPSLTATQWDLNYQPNADFTVDAAGPTIATSFGTPGPKTVAVKVTQTGGGFDIAQVTILVNAPPVASFNVTPDELEDGDEATFASTSEDPDGAVAKHEWDLNNDGRYDKQGRVVSEELKRGTHTVRLRVTDAKGATATTTQDVKVTRKSLRNPPDVTSSISYIRRKWGAEVLNFTVAVPSRTSVTVKCKGRGCPRGTFRKRSKRKKAVLRFPKLDGNLRAGAKISIIFIRPGHITGWDTITIRGDYRRTVRREQCKLPGAKKPKACPN